MQVLLREESYASVATEVIYELQTRIFVYVKCLFYFIFYFIIIGILFYSYFFSHMMQTVAAVSCNVVIYLEQRLLMLL